VKSPYKLLKQMLTGAIIWFKSVSTDCIGLACTGLCC